MPNEACEDCHGAGDIPIPGYTGERIPRATCASCGGTGVATEPLAPAPVVVYLPPTDVDVVQVDHTAFAVPLAEVGEMAKRYARLFHLPLWCCWSAAIDWVAAQRRIEPWILHAAHRAEKSRRGVDGKPSGKASWPSAR